MALSLTLRKGNKFFVEGEAVLITEAPEGEMNVRVASKDGEFILTEDKNVEVLKDVRVSVGSMVEEGLVRLAIDAPRHMTILREKHMREQGL